LNSLKKNGDSPHSEFKSKNEKTIDYNQKNETCSGKSMAKNICSNPCSSLIKLRHVYFEEGSELEKFFCSSTCLLYYLRVTYREGKKDELNTKGNIKVEKGRKKENEKVNGNDNVKDNVKDSDDENGNDSDDENGKDNVKDSDDENGSENEK